MDISWVVSWIMWGWCSFKGRPEFFPVGKGGTSFFPWRQRRGSEYFYACKRSGSRKSWRPAITNRWPSLPVKNDSSLTKKSGSWRTPLWTIDQFKIAPPNNQGYYLDECPAHVLNKVPNGTHVIDNKGSLAGYWLSCPYFDTLVFCY